MQKIILPILAALVLAACASEGAVGYKPMGPHPMDHMPKGDGP